MKTERFNNDIKQLEEFHIRADKVLTIILVTPINHLLHLGEPKIFVMFNKDSYYTLYDSIESFYHKGGQQGRIFEAQDTYYKNGNGLRQDGYKRCIQYLEKYKFKKQGDK